MEEGAIFRDEIEIFVLLFSCFETRSRLDIVILMFRDENEKHRLNFSRSSEKNLSQFSRDLARTRILADLCCEVREIGEEGLRRRTGNDSKQKRGICSEAAPQLRLAPSSSFFHQRQAVSTKPWEISQVFFASATLSVLLSLIHGVSCLSMPSTLQCAPQTNFYY